MALLYGALVLLVGVSLLITSIYLIDRSIAQSPLYAGSFGKLKITDGTGRTLFEGDPAVLGVTARSEARSYLLHTGLIYFLVVVVIGASGGYLLAKQALRPLAQMSAMARKIGTETLDERIHLGGPADELRELADTFDDMIERLEAAFASQRLFVANASHELRTPLSVMRTELDVTLSDPDASVQDLRQMGDVVLGATERAQRLVGSLLILARLQAGEVAELEMHEEVDLAAIVPGVVSTVEAEMRDRGIAVDKDLQPAPTVGDPRLLERLIGNLV
jgi:signal transduction histidine kinase